MSDKCHDEYYDESDAYEELNPDDELKAEWALADECWSELALEEYFQPATEEELEELRRDKERALAEWLRGAAAAERVRRAAAERVRRAAAAKRRATGDSSPAPRRDGSGETT